MDINKYNVLAELVREARAADKDLAAKMEQARLAWKTANEVLTERQKVFDDYVAGCKNEDTITPT
jgi:hypothetical protein